MLRKLGYDSLRQGEMAAREGRNEVREKGSLGVSFDFVYLLWHHAKCRIVTKTWDDNR